MQANKYPVKRSISEYTPTVSKIVESAQDKADSAISCDEIFLIVALIYNRSKD